MSDSADQPWSNHPNAPHIPYWLYLAEKESMAGNFLGAMCYGIVIALFFQCMRVLLTPSKTIKTTVKWALVVHTVAMFSFITASLGIFFDWASAVYINNREYFGNHEKDIFPGPLGYLYILGTGALGTVYAVMFPLNQLIADGLLLYRCYVICSMNHWVMAFPYLMYLASVTMGISHVYEMSVTMWDSTAINCTVSYYSISLGLNVLLTLMIFTRLIWHRRTFQVGLGASDGSSGPYKAIATMIIESYALYAVALLAYTISWAISLDSGFFVGIARSSQVIAPYLIILRVAKGREVRSESISGSFESMRSRSQGSANGDGSLHDGDLTNVAGANGEGPAELVARDENAIEEVPL